MKRRNLLKNSIAYLCSAALLMLSVFVCNDKVSAEPQGIQLSLENVEVDINNIPADRKVQVPVSISGNPGFKQLLFNIEKDPRLQYAQTPSENPFEQKAGISSIDFFFLSDDKSVLRGQFNADSIYSENNIFSSVGFILPEELSAGDEFSVSFNSSFNSNNNYYTYGIDINDGNNIYSNSSFLTGVNASIKVVDSAAVTEVVTEQTDESYNKYSFTGEVQYGFDSENGVAENDNDIVDIADASDDDSQEIEKLKFRVNHIDSFNDDDVLDDVKVFDGDAELVSCFIIVSFCVIVILVTLIIFRINQLKKRNKSGVVNEKKTKKKK